MAKRAELLTVEQVAAYCGLSRKAIYRAIDRGELRATKRCSRWRVFRDDLVHWLDEGVRVERSTRRSTASRGGPMVVPQRGSFRQLLIGQEGTSDATTQGQAQARPRVGGALPRRGPA